MFASAITSVNFINEIFRIHPKCLQNEEVINAVTVPNVMINAEMCDDEGDEDGKEVREELGEEARHGAAQDLSMLDIQRCKFCAGDWSTMIDFMKSEWGITPP